MGFPEDRFDEEWTEKIRQSKGVVQNMGVFTHQVFLFEAGSWRKIEKPFLFFNEACKLASAYAEKRGEDRIKIESTIQNED